MSYAAERIGSMLLRKYRPGTIKAKLRTWRILKNQNDISLMASRLRHENESGTKVSFTRMGEAVPIAKIEDYLKVNPDLEASNARLPAHIRVIYSDAADTAANSRSPTEETRDESLPQEHAMPVQDNHKQQGGLKRTARAVSPWPAESSKRAKTRATDDAAIQSPPERATKTDDQRPSEEKLSAEEAKVERVFLALEKLSFIDTNCTTALQRAKRELTTAIRSQQESLSHKDRTDAGPLHAAAVANNLKIGELLLTYDADVNSEGGCKVTALHCAVAKGHIDFVKFLLQQSGININAVDSDGQTPLHFAVVHPWVHCTVLLLQHDADVNIIDCDGRSPLYYACMERGMLEQIEIMLTKTTTINAKDKLGLTPLAIAICYENTEYIVPLLEKGADLNIASHSGRTPFMMACLEVSPEMLLMLLRWEPNLTVIGNEHETALHLLCQRGFHDVIKPIIEHGGVDIDARTKKGITPLMLAVNNNHPQSVRILVEHEADLSVRNVWSETALCMAIEKGYSEIAEILIVNGSPVNPTGQSLVKHRSQIESAQRTQQQLFVLNSIGVGKNKQREKRSRQAPRSGRVFGAPTKKPTLLSSFSGIGLGIAAGYDQRRGGPATGMAEVQNQNLQFNPFMSNSGMGLFESVDNDQYSLDFPIEEGYFGGFTSSI